MHTKFKSVGKGPPIEKNSLVKSLEVIKMRSLALQMANASLRAENKTYVIVDVGDFNFGPYMAIVAFVRAIHGFGHRMKGQDANGECPHIYLPSNPRGKKFTPSICNVSLSNFLGEDLDNIDVDKWK